MKVNTSMTAWYINEKLDFRESVSFSGELPAEFVQVLEDPYAKKGGLYIVPENFIFLEDLPHGKASYILLEERLVPYFEEENYCLIKEPLPGKDLTRTAITLLQAIGEFFLDLSRLEKEVLRLDGSDAAFEEYFPYIYEIFPWDYLVLDNNLGILGASSDLARNYFGSWEYDLSNRDQFTDMMYNPAYRDNSFKREPFIIYHQTRRLSFYCRNYIRKDQYMGALVIYDGKFGDWSAQKAAVVEYLAFLLEDAFFKKVEDTHRLSKNIRVHELLEKALSGEGKKTEASVWEELLAPYGCGKDDSYCAVTLSFFEGIESNATGSYVCGLIENQWAYSFALLYEENIYWIIDCTRHKINQYEDSFKKMIQNTVSSYICRAGISDFFQGFEDLEAYIYEAKCALELGQKKAPYLWYHVFKDHALDLIVEKASSRLSARQISHKGLQDLMEYDKVHKTSYVRSLKTYFECGGNVSLAAQKLFLHRTSLVRQLDRIEKIMGCSLKGSYEESLYIQISLLILENENEA